MNTVVLDDPRMIAAVLRAELARRRIPAVALIGILPLERSAVYDRLNGRVALTFGELRRIADGVGIPFTVLTGRDPADVRVCAPRNMDLSAE